MNTLTLDAHTKASTMTTLKDQFDQSLPMVQQAIQRNDAGLLKTSLDVLTEGMVEALSTGQFYLVEIANGGLRELFKSMEIIPAVIKGHLSEQALGLLLERVAPTPHLIWNAGTDKMSSALCKMLARNCLTFWPKDHASHLQLLNQFSKPDQQEAKSEVLDYFLTNVATAEIERFGCPLTGLDSIWSERKKEYIKGQLSEPVAQVLINRKDVVITYIARRLSRYRAGSLPSETEALVPFPVVQQLHALGFVELAPSMYPAILGTRDNVRQFTLAEEMGVAIEETLVDRALTKLGKDHHALPAMAYVLESPRFTADQLKAFLVKDSRRSRDDEQDVLKTQLGNVGAALKAVYGQAGKSRDPLVHEKTRVLLKWIASLSMDCSDARRQIISIRKLPETLLREFPSFMEDKLASDIGL